MTIPHPELWRRRFVLQPFSDLVPNGALGGKVRAALVALGDEQAVWPYPSPEAPRNVDNALLRG